MLDLWQKGHIKSSCPKKDEKGLGESLSNKKNPSNTTNTNANLSSSKKPNASAVIDKDVDGAWVVGAWAVIAGPFVNGSILDENLEEDLQGDFFADIVIPDFLQLHNWDDMPDIEDNEVAHLEESTNLTTIGKTICNIYARMEGEVSVVILDFIQSYNWDNMPDLEYDDVDHLEDKIDISKRLCNIYRMGFREIVQTLKTLGIPGFIPFVSGLCQLGIKQSLDYDYTDGPGGGWGISIDEKVFIPMYIFVATELENTLAWDLYDSGASHHMSPCRNNFINFQEIPPKL